LQTDARKNRTAKPLLKPPGKFSKPSGQTSAPYPSKGSGRRSVQANEKAEILLFSVISQGPHPTPGRAEATKTAMFRILQADNLSGKVLNLRNRLKS
jgi:hypothetical protein